MSDMTCRVIKTVEALFATSEIIAELEKNDSIKRIGTDGTDWLGVPLLNYSMVIEVMAIQSYSEEIRYQIVDLELMGFTVQHIVTAMICL
jgi:hypothetical protein